MVAELAVRAERFAIRAHGEQKRKYTGEPYYYHLRAVSDIVRVREGTPEMIAAAWLHDVLEDTDTSHRELLAAFGEKVTRMVFDLTDFAGEGNRAFRKEMDRNRLAASSSEAKTIKLADLIDNTRNIVPYDKNFARVYLAEKELLLPCLKGGDAVLWELAQETLEGAQRELVQHSLGKMEEHGRK